MKKDPTQFRERFNRWKAGQKVYEAGKPIESYEEGKPDEINGGDLLFHNGGEVMVTPNGVGLNYDNPVAKQMIPVGAQYTDAQRHEMEGERGAMAVRRATNKAAKYLAPLVMAPAGAALSVGAPGLSLLAPGTKAGTLAADFVIGGLGAQITDDLTERMYGKPWGEYVSDIFSMIPGTQSAHQTLKDLGNAAADYTNPGGWLGIQAAKPVRDAFASAARSAKNKALEMFPREQDLNRQIEQLFPVVGQQHELVLTPTLRRKQRGVASYTEALQYADKQTKIANAREEFSNTYPDADIADYNAFLSQHPELVTTVSSPTESYFIKAPHFGEDYTDVLRNYVNWHQQDVVPRLTRSATDVGDLAWFRGGLFSDPLLDGIQTRFVNLPANKYYGWSEKDGVTVLVGAKDMPETIAHEFHHSYRDVLGDKNGFNRHAWSRQDLTGTWKDAYESNLVKNHFKKGNYWVESGYTNKEASALDDAYEFTDDYILDNDISPLFEKGATNAELRYSYSDNGRLHGKELDDVIDGLSWTNLTTRLQNINGYGNNFVKNLNSKMRGMSVEERRKFKVATLAKIKHAMKYVGMFSGAAYVGSQMQSNDRKINKPQIR